MSGNSSYINLPGGPPSSHPQEQGSGSGAQGTPTSSLMGHATPTSQQSQSTSLASKVNPGTRMVPIPGAPAPGSSASASSASGSPMALGACATGSGASVHGAAGVGSAGGGAGAGNIQNVAPQHSAAAVVAGGSSVTAAAVAAVAANSTNQDLASLFECPVCFDYVLPPILQCHAGHLVCSNCRPKLTCCPTCRGQLGGNIRNLAMEKVASTVMFPCRYQSSGCGVSLLHTEKLDHEETCEFRPYSCPCPGASCKWQGSLEQVMAHLMQIHKSITTLQGEDIVFLATDINLPGAVDWVMMQSCFGHHFMLVLEKQEKFDGHQQFFAIVQLIGTRKQAENFAYRLELNGHRRRLTWEATPRSIHEGVSSAILNSDCLVFDTSIAQLFADNGNLGINVTISMC